MFFGIRKVLKDLEETTRKNQERYYSTRRKLIDVYLEDMRKFEALEEKATSFSEKTYWRLKHQEVERKFYNVVNGRALQW